MTAAELLRSLQPRLGPREFNELTGEDRHARVIAWAQTINLLPELAALVEAVEGYITFNRARRHAELIDALDNLNAKAAELGGK